MINRPVSAGSNRGECRQAPGLAALAILVANGGGITTFCNQACWRSGRDHTCRHAAAWQQRWLAGDVHRLRRLSGGARWSVRRHARGAAGWRERAVAIGGIAVGDPDLVMQAEQAAMALEHAWRHWRRRHGLPAESMLPVSSYVGYSPAEPWGQPRVVFGMAAEDAAKLTTLLEGHDCVGPVHAGLVSLPGSQVASTEASDAGERVVPRQVPAGHTSKPRPARLRPPRRSDPLDPAQAVEYADPHVTRRLLTGGSDDLGYAPAEIADAQDGPVFRQAAAAAAEAAATRHAAEAAARLRAVAAAAATGQPLPAVSARRVQPAAATGQPGSTPTVARPVAAHALTRPGTARIVTDSDTMTTRAEPGSVGQDPGAAGGAPVRRFSLPGESAVPAPRGAGDAGHADQAGRSAVYQAVDSEPPGPLTLAAAAARAAAEARIKAARLDPRAAAGLADPYAIEQDLQAGSGAGLPTADAAEGARATLVLPPFPVRPEVISRAGLAGPLPVYPGLLSGGFRPASEASPGLMPGEPGRAANPSHPGREVAADEAAQDAGVVEFRPRPASLGGDQVPRQIAGEADETTAPGLDRRGRLGQFGIPRLPRGRRPGAAPGTA